MRETHRPLIVTQKGRASTVIISAEALLPRGGGARMGVGDLALRCNAGKAQQGLNS